MEPRGASEREGGAASSPPAAGAPETEARPRASLWRRAARGALLVAASIVLVPASAWAACALYFDLPAAGLRLPAAILYVVAIAVAIVLVPGAWLRVLVAACGFALVLGWWLTLRPSNDRDWQPDVAVLPWAEFEGDRVTVHDVRRCVYRSETDYDVLHDDRTYDLSKLASLDLFLVHWGSPLIAHTMMSFGFEDGRYLCISIEVRKKKGDAYSAIRGFFRQYEVAYIIADERDLVWLRTNVRRGEEVRLYRLKPRPDVPRKLLTHYLQAATSLRGTPRWYNALSQNCTTSVILLTEQARGSAIPFDWRIVLNGRIDELLYEQGKLAGDVPFERLKEAALINPRTAGLRPDEHFSEAIREGLPGF